MHRPSFVSVDRLINLLMQFLPALQVMGSNARCWVLR
jgi:hypothetical protein